MRYSLNLAHKIAKGALFLSRKIEDMENLSSKTTLNYTALQNYVLNFLGRSLERNQGQPYAFSAHKSSSCARGSKLTEKRRKGIARGGSQKQVIPT